jgi:hypothetical protein
MRKIAFLNFKQVFHTLVILLKFISYNEQLSAAIVDCSAYYSLGLASGEPTYLMQAFL